ncbi:DUF2953 domain-containing protein [Virgibacillus doumboii]|uniref:DUF2953 domain-containing protein n=1 Tax=Virgibacillus doumboii TaxID=2697503 RepID=UPI0013DF4DB5|nr:DUF2953 domain-containing protein [Virgibacillus doumboii]
MIWLLLGFILIIILLLFSKVKVKSAFFLNQQQQTITINIYFYRLRLIRRCIDLSETDEDKSIREALEFLHQISNNFVQKIKDMNDIFTILFRRIHFHQLNWRTHVGTGEASMAGVASGGIWAIKGMLIGVLAEKSNFDCEPSLTVTPLFNHRQFQSEFDCIVSIRIGQAMYALLKVIRKFPVKKEAII